MGGADTKQFYTTNVKKINKLIVTFEHEIIEDKKREIIQLVKENMDPRIKRIRFEEGDKFTILFSKRMRATTKARVILRVKNTLSELDDFTPIVVGGPTKDARAIRVIEKIKNPSKRVAWINPDKCAGCQECVEVCPKSAIENREENIFVIPELCTDCDKECFKVCQVGAITYIKRE